MTKRFLIFIFCGLSYSAVSSCYHEVTSKEQCESQLLLGVAAEAIVQEKSRTDPNISDAERQQLEGEYSRAVAFFLFSYADCLSKVPVNSYNFLEIL